MTVAVLGLLIGVLAPSLGASRDSARAAACAAALRELQVANLSHAASSNGRFVAGAANIEGANLERWHGRREAVGEPFTPEGGALSAHLGGAATSEALRECAGLTWSEVGPEAPGFERGGGGYGYNNAFVGVVRSERGGVWEIETNRVGSRQERFARPSATAAFTDAGFAADAGLIEYSFAEPPEWPEHPGSRPDPSVHFRHRGRSGVAWLDGHVTSEARAFSAWSQLYLSDPGPLGLGWFGREADGNALFDYE